MNSGFARSPSVGGVVTNELIDRLRDDDEFEHLRTEISKAFSSYAEDEVDSLVDEAVGAARDHRALR